MTKFRLISGLVLCAGTALQALPAAAEVGHHVITVEEIAAAVSGAGMKISPAQVVLLTDVVATTSTPRLNVESMERWGDHRMKVRMDCAQEECLPFFVAVEAKAGDQAGLAISAPAAQAKTGANAFMVRAGSPAVLLLDGDHVHIKLTVVCLENGTSGQTIRVSSPDHRQTYLAQVGEGTVLRGRLQ